MIIGLSQWHPFSSATSAQVLEKRMESRPQKARDGVGEEADLERQ